MKGRSPPPLSQDVSTLVSEGLIPMCYAPARMGDTAVEARTPKWKRWTGGIFATLAIAGWAWINTRPPLPSWLPIAMGCAISVVLAAFYFRARASIWTKIGFTVVMVLLFGALSYFGMTLRYNNWTLLGLFVLFLFMPERERRPWWPAVKRTVDRMHEDPQSDEKKVAELLRRPNA